MPKVIAFQPRPSGEKHAAIADSAARMMSMPLADVLEIQAYVIERERSAAALPDPAQLPQAEALEGAQASGSRCR